MTTPTNLPVINKLSDNFTYAEGIVSAKAKAAGVDNSPDPESLQRMYRTADKMEKVRIILGNNPIKINNWFRNLVVNKLVGSTTTTSQHLFGEAVDFICPKFGTPLDICKAIIANKDLINYDQLILEHTWVHISFAIRSGKPRNQVLSLIKDKKYASGLTDMNGKPYTY